MRVYFAGPLFTPYERSFIDECAARLRAEGIDVFVPHENALADGDTSAATIFAKDWQGLSEADAVVAVLDGPMVDDGTACEIGIFYALMQADPSKKGILGPPHRLARHARPRGPWAQPLRARLRRGGRQGLRLAGRGRRRARRVALALAVSAVLARAPILPGAAVASLSSLAFVRRARVALAALVLLASVAVGAAVAA